jgi:hypothetical protein
MVPLIPSKNPPGANCQGFSGNRRRCPSVQSKGVMVVIAVGIEVAWVGQGMTERMSVSGAPGAPDKKEQIRV